MEAPAHLSILRYCLCLQCGAHFQPRRPRAAKIRQHGMELPRFTRCSMAQHSVHYMLTVRTLLFAPLFFFMPLRSYRATEQQQQPCSPPPLLPQPRALCSRTLRGLQSRCASPMLCMA